MKKIACVFIELEDHETVDDVIAKLEKRKAKVNNSKVNNKDITSDWRVKLTEILTNLGENISSLGYGILFDIMECVEKNPEYKEYFLVKQLYAYVTEKTGRPYIQVERNIRAMIERIYKKNSIDKICEILGASAVSCGKVPNRDFLAIIIQKIF